jgi:putative transposase
MKKRFTEAQIVGFLREADAGLPVKDLCWRHGFSEGSYYLWRSKFGGMSVSDANALPPSPEVESAAAKEQNQDDDKEKRICTHKQPNTSRYQT